jgi:hypothetical protein
MDDDANSSSSQPKKPTPGPEEPQGSEAPQAGNALAPE